MLITFSISTLNSHDLLEVGNEEKRLLDHIAKRAYDGNPFDISELDGDTQSLVDKLIHMRLVIRTGTTYNIYWDIFRDYIVTNEIPVLGESYLIRQSSYTCLDAFLIFQKSRTLPLDILIDSYPKKISEKAILNILLELRSFGLIRKLKGKDEFEITERVTSVSKEFFESFITQKFENYTPYIELLKLEKKKITTDDIKDVLKRIFKTEKFEENTWHAYAKQLVRWFGLSKLDIKNRIVESKRSKGSIYIDKESHIPYYSPAALFESYSSLLRGKSINIRKIRDLYLLGLLTESDTPKTDVVNIYQFVYSKALSIKKINEVYKVIKKNSNINQNEFIESNPEALFNFHTLTSKKQASSILFNWAKYCIKYESGDEINISPRKRGNGIYFYAFGPNNFISIFKSYVSGKLVLNPNNKRKLRDIEHLGFLDFENGNYKLNDLGRELDKSDKPLNMIAKQAIKDENILLFMKHCKNENDSPNIEEIIDAETEFFSQLNKHSSRRAKCSVFYSWAKFIRQNNNGSL